MLRFLFILEANFKEFMYIHTYMLLFALIFCFANVRLSMSSLSSSSKHDLHRKYLVDKLYFQDLSRKRVGTFILLREKNRSLGL